MNPEPHGHRSLREHLVELAERGHEPVFQPSRLPPLVAFAELFATTSWFSFDVTKWLPADGLTRTYELTSEVRTSAAAEPEASTVSWSPVPLGADPFDGFGTGTSSVLWGGSAEVPPPDDTRTRAFLLLVTTDLVHLSASREQEPPLVRAAVDGPGDQYEYVVLVRRCGPTR